MRVWKSSTYVRSDLYERTHIKYTYQVGEVIGRRNFDGRGQVEYDLLEMVGSSFTPSLLDSFADLEGELGLRLRERLRTVLEPELGAV